MPPRHPSPPPPPEIKHFAWDEIEQGIVKLRRRVEEVKALDAAMQERLINWGYAICDVAMRKHVEPNLPLPGGFRYPANSIG